MNDPLISMNFLGGKRVFQPAEPLEFEYQIDAVQDEQLAAVEASLLWYTDGKGDEDMAVHYFERRVRGGAGSPDLRSLRRFRTVLPNTPLSYNGIIVKVRWCVRVRVFLRGGREFVQELPFQIGRLPRARYTDSSVQPLS